MTGNKEERTSMPFCPIPELLDELRAGRMVVIVDDEDRENEGDLIMAAELVKPSDINFMVTHARGLVCLSLTRERCRQLGLPPMVRDNTSPHGTNFTVSIEAAEGVTTGISAYDRAHTIRTAVRPDAQPADLSQPGHIFPLMAQPGGVLSRAGHTEAASDLALLAGFEPAGVLVEILNPDGSMARRPQLETFAREHGLKIGSIEDLIRHRLATEHTVERVDARDIDTDHGPFRLFTYRDRLSRALHFALLRGDADATVPTLVRVHALNPLADALHWRRADFGPAVGDVLAAIAREGRGALVLLGEAEGTPAQQAEALLARIRESQVEPRNPGRGGALAEWRRNGAGSQILADLGLGKLRVLGTPRRQVGLAGFGLEVVAYVDPTRDA
jgi:3,4-dihydroxy 2-butanone 4-phosphate synthase/GTP cyclohydrolase II